MWPSRCVWPFGRVGWWWWYSAFASERGFCLVAEQRYHGADFSTPSPHDSTRHTHSPHTSPNWSPRLAALDSDCPALLDFSTTLVSVVFRFAQNSNSKPPSPTNSYSQRNLHWDHREGARGTLVGGLGAKRPQLTPRRRGEANEGAIATERPGGVVAGNVPRSEHRRECGRWGQGGHAAAE